MTFHQTTRLKCVKSHYLACTNKERGDKKKKNVLLHMWSLLSDRNKKVVVKIVKPGEVKDDFFLVLTPTSVTVCNVEFTQKQIKITIYFLEV